MADRPATVKVPLGMQAHSAYIALGDDELRRWETHCRGLEDGEVYPWAAEESRALVSSILGCVFGEDLSHLEGPSRTWARTNSTMAIFTRRLGCLRELVGQESMMNGPDSFDRLQEIFDKVTIVATEAALASLAYVNVSPHEMNGRIRAADAAAVVSDSHEAGAQRPGPSRWRRRTLLTLVMVAVAALVAGLAFALTSPSTVHHPVGPKTPGHTRSTHGGSTAKSTTGRSPSAPAGSRSGTTGQPRSSSSATSGGASGLSRTGSGTGTGSNPTQTTGTSTGTTGSGAAPGQGGSTTVTLPSGAQLTVPQLTIP
jgi:hypothetical protein